MEPVKGGVLSPTEAATGHLHVVGDLDDVETDGALEGDALVFTGDAWVPGAVASGTGADEVQIRTDAPPDTVELWVDTDEAYPVAMALGKVAMANPATFTDPTSFTTIADVAGLSVSWVADPTRLYKITATGQTDQITAVAQQTMYVTDAANAVLMSGSYGINSATLGYTWWSMPYTESGLSGTITRKVRMAATAASGRLRSPANWRLLVEDIGLA